METCYNWSKLNLVDAVAIYFYYVSSKFDFQMRTSQQIFVITFDTISFCFPLDNLGFKNHFYRSNSFVSIDIQENFTHVGGGFAKAGSNEARFV